MQERPILFSGPMVRAILAGAKTQTRRVIRWPDWISAMYPDQFDVIVRELLGGGRVRPSDHSAGWFAPRFCVGERLWVRETWKVGAWKSGDRFAIDYAAGPVGQTPWVRPPTDAAARLARESLTDCECYVERAPPGDERVSDEGARYTWEVGNSPCRWRPSIFMPRWASRLTLDIVEVRVQRLQDISESDAEAEGIAYHPAAKAIIDSSMWTWTAAFAAGWNVINGKRPGCAWRDNPWVWAITFRRSA